MLKGKEKELELNFKTVAMLKFEDDNHIKDPDNFWRTAAQRKDLKIMGKALVVFSGGTLKGQSDAYEFMDDYLSAGHTIADMYNEFVTELNEKGFFGHKKMDSEAISAELAAPPINTNEIFNDAMKEASKNMGRELGEIQLKNAVQSLTDTE